MERIKWNHVGESIASYNYVTLNKHKGLEKKITLQRILFSIVEISAYLI